jgi:hypothetical protein
MDAVGERAVHSGRDMTLNAADPRSASVSQCGRAHTTPVRAAFDPNRAFTQSVIGPLPSRGRGRAPSETAIHITISSGRGASATITVKVSK